MDRLARTPYKILFPIGIANAAAGASLWTLHAFGLIGWPSQLHPILMIEGFELSFVMGFLLTVMPAFTRGAWCHPLELLLALSSIALVDAFAFAGLMAAAHAACLLGLLTVAAAALRRALRGARRPPEEFLFVAFGFALGIAGVTMLAGSAAGWWIEPQPRFGARLISLGFVLSIVLGVGSLLVPTFSGMRDPLAIPGLARAHQREPRRALYLPLILLLASAFALEASGHARLGAGVRAAIGGVMGLLVWKLWRRPARATVPAYVLWLSGWFIMIGLALAALDPAFALAGEHVVFIGGFGWITLGVATRVVTGHGGHPEAIELGVLRWPALLSMTALVLRVIAEFDPAHATPLLGAGGAAWALAWLVWGSRIVYLITRPPRAADMIQIRSA